MYAQTSFSLEMELQDSGSMCVSLGTLRPYDLFNKFFGVVLDYHNGGDKEIRKFIRDVIRTIPEEAWDNEDHAFWDTGEASEIVTELEDAISQICPIGWYFGTAEGDGACFGFWPDNEEDYM